MADFFNGLKKVILLINEINRDLAPKNVVKIIWSLSWSHTSTLTNESYCSLSLSKRISNHYNYPSNNYFCLHNGWDSLHLANGSVTNKGNLSDAVIKPKWSIDRRGRSFAITSLKHEPLNATHYILLFFDTNYIEIRSVGQQF